jgi:ferredoxin-NADP reductase
MDLEIRTNKNSVQKKHTKSRIEDEYVFIVDSLGVTSAFSMLKAKLSDNKDYFLSVVYLSDTTDTRPLFKNELKFIGKRFQSKLSVTYVETNSELPIDSQKIEIIINSQTAENQHFIVIGEHVLVEKVVDQLLFLCINTNRIDTQVIKK